MSNKPLIILADFGLDDACAFTYLLKHSSRFCSIDVVCIAGNVSQQNSLINAKKLLKEIKKETDMPNIRLVDTTAVPQNFAVLEDVHGTDGMGGLLELTDDGIEAVKYGDFIKNLPLNPVVLSLGPCTVSLDLLGNAVNPSLIMMAGNILEKPNYNGLEFNEALDYGAYKKQLLYSHSAATLDTARAEQFNLAGSRFFGGGLFYRFLNRAIELAEMRHKDNCYVYDLIAALYLIIPEIFMLTAAVDTKGNKISQLSIKDKKFSLKEYLSKD